MLRNTLAAPPRDTTLTRWPLTCSPLVYYRRALVPPVGGVDVSPIIWVGMISFLNEILLGKQGLLILLSTKSSEF